MYGKARTANRRLLCDILFRITDIGRALKCLNKSIKDKAGEALYGRLRRLGRSDCGRRPPPLQEVSTVATITTTPQPPARRQRMRRSRASPAGRLS